MGDRQMQVVSFHSLAMFMLSWLLLFLLQNLVITLLAMSLDIPVLINFYKTFFLIPPTQWNADAVKVLFVSPQVISFVYAVACFVVVYNVNRFTGILKLFFIWGFVHGWVTCFGGMLIGMLTNSGFGYAADWMYLFDTMKLVLSMASLAMLVAGGFLISHSWQMSSNIYFGEINEDQFPRFLFFEVSVVAFVGTLLLVLLRIPAPLGIQLILPSLIVMLLPVMLKGEGFSDLQFDDKPRAFKLNRLLLMITAFVIIVVRIIFGIGVRFGDASVSF